jgi:hypothetical protein
VFKDGVNGVVAVAADTGYVVVESGLGSFQFLAN